MVLKRQNLEAMTNKGCQEKGCTHHEETIFIHAVCHMDSGLEASYSPGSGKLKLACLECKKFIAEIAVAN